MANKEIKSVFFSYLNAGLNWLNLKINEDKKKLLYDFYNLILEENKKFNLTRLTDIKDFVELHIVDSLSIIELLRKDRSLGLSVKEIKNLNILDIGSGGGFPGVPLNLVFPENNYILVEATQKKANFLVKCREILKSNYIVLSQRSEILAPQKKYQHNFDLVLVRAVAPFLKSLKFALPFINKNGSFVYYGVALAKDNLIFKKNNFKIVKTVNFNLPFSQAKRCLVQVKNK